MLARFPAFNKMVEAAGIEPALYHSMLMIYKDFLFDFFSWAFCGRLPRQLRLDLR